MFERWRGGGVGGGVFGTVVNQKNKKMARYAKKVAETMKTEKEINFMKF